MTILTKSLLMIIIFFYYSWGTENQFNIGIINGINYSFAAFTSHSPYKFKSSAQVKYNIYLYTDYNINPSFSINSGIRFSFIKVRLNNKTTLNVGTELPKYYTYDFNYFILPLRLKWNLNNIYFVSGAEIGYLISVKGKAFDYRNDFNERNLISKYHKFNVSGIIGMGYKINYNSSRIIFELGYSRGFLNIVKEQIPFKDWKTNEAYFNFGLEFYL